MSRHKGRVLAMVGAFGCRSVAMALLVDARPEGEQVAARCPFHEERSPGGFSYDPTNDRGCCLSCNQTGDLFDIFCSLTGQPPNTQTFRDFEDRMRELVAFAEPEAKAQRPPAPEPLRYVLGFYFAKDWDNKHVLLIQQAKPGWQQGLRNGLGGEVEDSADDPDGIWDGEDMAREFLEESGGHGCAWEPYAFMDGYNNDGSPFECYVFRAFGPWFRPVSSDEGLVGWFPMDNLPPDTVASARWLIPLALSKGNEGLVRVTYRHPHGEGPFYMDCNACGHHGSWLLSAPCPACASKNTEPAQVR